ncbi:signal peptidase II, partial [candidate division KSB1 bacterium]|nr:signal peptidase II [candidate division KSB1 bacterium]
SVRPDIRKWIIYPLTLIALAFLITLIWQMRHDSIWWLAALMLILSGAIGNLSERVMRGFVVDFIHLHYYDTWSWPIFNVADILITCGGILLAFRMFKKTSSKSDDTMESAA